MTVDPGLPLNRDVLEEAVVVFLTPVKMTDRSRHMSPSRTYLRNRVSQTVGLQLLYTTVQTKRNQGIQTIVPSVSVLTTLLV